MPRGVRDHQHTSEGSMEKLYLKVGEDDPNTARPAVSHTALLPEAERTIFVQVAALNSLNSQDTFDFMRQFIKPSITHANVSNMIDEYRAEIIGARNAVALYVDQKFPAFNPIKQAETINRGLSLCTSLMNQYATYPDRKPKATKKYRADHEEEEVNNFEQEAHAKWVDRAARGLASVTKSYESWSAQKAEWGRMVDAIIADFAAQRNPAMAQKLDPRKIASVAKQVGVDGFIADRLAQLLVYGEQRLTRDDEDESSKYFTDGEPDGDKVLPGIEEVGIPEPRPVAPADSGPGVPDPEDDKPSDDRTGRRGPPRVEVTRSILAS